VLEDVQGLLPQESLGHGKEIGGEDEEEGREDESELREVLLAEEEKNDDSRDVSEDETGNLVRVKHSSSSLTFSRIRHQNNIGRHRIRRSLSGKRSFLLLEDGPGRDPHGPGAPEGNAVFAEEKPGRHEEETGFRTPESLQILP
jgi:hypothetical protein